MEKWAGYRGVVVPIKGPSAGLSRARYLQNSQFVATHEELFPSSWSEMQGMSRFYIDDILDRLPTNKRIPESLELLDVYGSTCVISRRVLGLLHQARAEDVIAHSSVVGGCSNLPPFNELRLDEDPHYLHKYVF